METNKMSEKTSEPNLQEAITRRLIEHLESFVQDAREILRAHLDMLKELKFEVPDIDLHTVEHDSWRSWRKDDKGVCSFPAKEDESGWIRIKNCSNDVAILYKAMKKQGIDKIFLGFFEYKISGEDLLQRKRLKTVGETTETVKEQPQSQAIDNVRTLFPKDLEELLTFEGEGQFVILNPRQFLGSENFAKIATIVRETGGEYISAGKDSHFKVPLKKSK